MAPPRTPGNRPKASYETEDTVVFFSERHGLRLGIVNEVFEQEDSAGDSSSDSDSDNSDCDNCNDWKLQDGQVRIEWHPSGRTSKLTCEKPILIDRSLMIGETVQSLEDPSKVGFVYNAQVFADLLLLPTMSHVVKDVDCSTLKFVTELDPGNSYVLFDGWIGDLTGVYPELLLRSNKGYQFWLTIDAETDIYNITKGGARRGSSFDAEQWYVGQMVSVAGESVKENARFTTEGGRPPARLVRQLNMNSKAIKLKLTIQEVRLKSITADWITCLSANGQGHRAPDTTVEGTALDRVTRLDHFEHQSCQLGDRMCGVLRPPDELVTYDDWTHELKKTLEDKALGPAGRNRDRVPSNPESMDKARPGAAAGGSMFLRPRSPTGTVLAHSASASASCGSPASTVFYSASEGSVERLDVGDDCMTGAGTGGVEGGPTAVALDTDRNSRRQSSASFRQSARLASISRAKNNLGMNSKRKYTKLLQRRREQMANKRRQQDGGVVTRSQLPAAVADKYIGEVIIQRSYLDVVWQDGTMQQGIPATDLTYSDFDLDQHVFLPGYIVQSQDAGHGHGQGVDIDSDAVYGIVHSVNAAQRIAHVYWYSMSEQHTTQAPTFLRHEQTSVFDIKYHSDYEWLSTSSLVLRSVDGLDTDQVDTRALVGQVRRVNALTGKVMVRWFDNQETECWPTQLIRALFTEDNGSETGVNDESAALTSSLSVDNTNDDGWETMSSDDEDDDDTDQLLSHSFEESEMQRASRESLMSGTDSSHCVASASASNSSVSLAKRSSSDESASSKTNETSSQKRRKTSNEEAKDEHNLSVSNSALTTPTKKLQQCTMSMTTRSTSQAQAAASTSSNTHTPSPKASLNVPNNTLSPTSPANTTPAESTSTEKGTTGGTFQMLEDCPSEQHFSREAQPLQPNVHFLRALRQEAKLLSTSLPQGVHVRSFDTRMDLFSCLMVGPAGTPYYNGLFLLDARLPDQYPSVPPLVNYRSFASEQLNPNLYQDGKVCVSLLGTWTGRGSEKWNPGSSLLQVFVSIQGLILNSEPYFNEAGYDSRRALPDALDKSRRYNENALIRSLENTHNMAANPPLYFRHEVLQHVKHTAPDLVRAVRGWLDGSVQCDFPLLPISDGCKLSVNQRLNRLEMLVNKLQTDNTDQ